MELRRELFWTIGAVMAVNLALAFGAIGLFVRMGPAIARILEENVYSIVAAEEILIELGRAGDSGVSLERRQRIEAALKRAQENVTESEERPVLRSLATTMPAAISGDARARADAIDRLEAFLVINREAMQRVDREAQRLGVAGAWGAVLIGFSSFLVGLLAFTRLENRLLRPLAELHDVLETNHEGDRLRRCRRPEAPSEVVRVTDVVNRLLDERLTEASRSRATQHELERLALAELLERQTGAAALIDESGNIVRASAKMLALLAGAEGPALREALSRQEPADQTWERLPVRDRGALVLLPAQNPSRNMSC